MGNGQARLLDAIDPAISLRSFEEQGYARGFKCIAGLDEVGRGPLAGPVLAAAVVFPRGYQNAEIKDSKSLTSGQREKLAEHIKRDALGWAIGCVGVEEIDRINIFEASLMAMVKAYQALLPTPDYLLIDGNQKIPPALFHSIGVAVQEAPHQGTIVRGDRLSVSISAASILAKVLRDELMTALDASYPQYGFASHKGYTCTAHLEALRRFGPSPVHRKSFAPVRDLTHERCDDQIHFLFSEGDCE
jgi:ribonuclease HII